MLLLAMNAAIRPTRSACRHDAARQHGKESHDLLAVRSQRDSNTNLARAFRYLTREQRVQSNDCHDHREHGEQRKEQRSEAPWCHLTIDDRAHRPDGVDYGRRVH